MAHRKGTLTRAEEMQQTLEAIFGALRVEWHPSYRMLLLVSRLKSLHQASTALAQAKQPLNPCPQASHLHVILQAEEMQQAPLQQAAAPGAPAVVLRGASFSWVPGQPAVLSDISLQAAAGQLVMVVGEVGSGKSSLLAGLLGELCTTAVSGAVIMQLSRLGTHQT